MDDKAELIARAWKEIARDKPEKLVRPQMTDEIALNKLRLSDTLEERIFPMHVTSKPRII